MSTLAELATSKPMSIYTKLKKINDLTDEESRIKGLHQLSNKTLKDILSYTYDRNIEWLLPETDPPYTPSTERADHLASRLIQELRVLPMFLNIGSYQNMQESKRQGVFIQILQTVDPKDAEILLGMKNRELPFDNISRELVEKAFPLLAAKWVKRNG